MFPHNKIADFHNCSNNYPEQSSDESKTNAALSPFLPQ